MQPHAPTGRAFIGLWHAGCHSPTIRSLHCSLWTYRGDPDDLSARYGAMISASEGFQDLMARHGLDSPASLTDHPVVAAFADGPVALVLHGGLGVDHQMLRTLDPLAEHLRLVYLDHRGNGRSTGDVATATMEQWAADAAAVARHVSDEPVIVIGHSYGGFIAQEMLISQPDVVRAAILVTTTPGQPGTDEPPVPDGPPMPDEFAQMLATMPQTDDEYAAFMDRLAPAYLHRIGVDAMRDAMSGTRFRADAMRRGFEVLGAWSSVDRLDRVDVPVLLLAGRHDAFCAWPQSERIARRLPDAETVIFDHSGHLPWLDEPDAFFEAVVDWLHRRSLA